MESQNYISDVINDINTLRCDPSSAIKRFANVEIALRQFNAKEDLIKEFKSFVKILSNSPHIEALQVSAGLTKAAERQLELFYSNKFNSSYNKEELEFRCKDYVKNYTKIFQSADKGADDHLGTVNRLIMSKLDVDKVNRRILMDSSVKFIGVAHGMIEGENVVVIICADHVEEVNVIKSLDNAIVDYLNSIRTRPIEHLNYFELMTTQSKNKEINNLIKFLNKIKSKPMNHIHNHQLIRELCKSVIENNINDDESLHNLALKSFHGFNNLCFFRSDKNNAEEIVNDIILNSEYRVNFLENQEIKFIGVYNHNENNNNQSVIIIVDEIIPGPFIPFNIKFLQELNTFRQNPSSIITNLTEYKNNLKKLYASSKKDLIREVEDLITSLLNNKTPIQEIQLNEGIALAAEEYLNHLDQNNVKSFYAQDEEYLQISLSHYISGYTKCHEYVNTSAVTAESLLIDLLVNVESRSTLMNGEILNLGVVNGMIRGKIINILILTDKAEKSVDKTLLEEINNIRAHPKSYVKYVEKIIDEAKYPEDLKTKNEKENYMQSLYLLLNLLKNTRTFGPFVENNELKVAAKRRLEQFRNESIFNDDNNEDLNIFLSDFGSQFKITNQITINEKLNNSLDLLLQLLTTHKDVHRMYRNIIFSRSLNFIGIAQVENNQENSKNNINSIILFADNFNPHPDNLKIFILDHKRRLTRPELTEDELLQIQKDFKLFDSLNTGFIKPHILLLFMDRVEGYSVNNPIYYETVQLLNTEENNSNGVDVEEFTNAVVNVIAKIRKERTWNNLYQLYAEAKKINQKVLKELSDLLGYRMSNEQLEEILAKLNQDSEIDQTTFGEIMNLVEN